MQEFAGTVRVKESGQASTALTGDAAPLRTRITADSFRKLTARLKPKDDQQSVESIAEPAPLIEPEMQAAPWVKESPLPPVVQDTIAEWQTESSSQFQLPEFVPLNGMTADSVFPDSVEPAGEMTVESPEPFEPATIEAAAPLEIPPLAEFEPVEFSAVFEPETQNTAAAAYNPGRELEVPAEEEHGSLPEPEPSFAPIEAEAVAEEPAINGSVEDVAALGQPDFAVESVEPELSAPQITIEPVAIDEPEEAPPAVAVEIPPREAQQDDLNPVVAEPETTAALQPLSPAKPGRSASALTEKVVDALIKTVTEAVYSKPSAAERAAFLREVAELVERGEAEIPDAMPMQAVPGKDDSGTPAVAAATASAEPAGSVKQAGGGKLATGPSMLRRKDDADPFAAKAAFERQKPVESVDADEEAGTLAISLLDMMAGGSASSQPQERALAADTLLRLVPRIPIRQLLSIVERVAIMEIPPPLLVARLIRDQRPEVAGPLLERCMHISDQDLSTAVLEGDMHKLRMMARRRIISPALSDELIERGDASVVLTLVRNPGAGLNHDSFFRLAELAIRNPGILAPLTTRADLPAPVAFELFWHVPQELRRFIFSRFLTDSENLNRILKITLATQSGGDSAGEPKFPSRDALEAAMEALASGDTQACVEQLSELGGVGAEAVARVLADTEGEPLAVLLKTLGYPRSNFTELVERLQKSETGAIRRNRNPEELQSIFDTLSFNKARILLTYWDWFLKKAGPYAPHH